MLNKNINYFSAKKKVLIAPLDWGLGHATRCIPIIKALVQLNFEVIIASENAQEALLKNEFPNLVFLPLPGYNIKYSKTGSGFFRKILFQIPKILGAIKRENKWLTKAVLEHKIEIVVSDNRYGLYNKNVRSIFITHQLNIDTGNVFSNKIAALFNYHFINKFNECWVPDLQGEQSIAGKLSQLVKIPTVPVKYIGALSRFVKKDTLKNIDVTILISGPEPQRSVFENIVLKQIANSAMNIVFLRGITMNSERITVDKPNIKIYNHLTADALNKIIDASCIVISRSGYSTIMDLAVLQKAAIFVPTPGQTEQEYLAKYLSLKNYCIAINQDEFLFDNAVNQLNAAKLNLYPTQIKNNLEMVLATL